MKFEEFANKMESDLREALKGASLKAEIRRDCVNKLQNQSYIGLLVMPADGGLGVTVNLTSTYEQLLDGTPYCEVLDEAVDVVVNSLDREPPAINYWPALDYNKAKRLLCVEMIGTDRNADMLEKVPHTDVADLSMVYRILLGQSNLGATTVLVTNEMLTGYGITVKQLHADAMESAPLNRPGFIKPLHEIMAEMMGVPAEKLLDDQAPPMYIVSNEQRLMGASAIFYPGMMETAARKLNGSFYILPSSVHEVLLLPDDGRMDPEELAQIVSSINRQEVAPEDRLTDNVYYYDAVKSEFMAADKARKILLKGIR